MVWNLKPGDADPRMLVYFILSQNGVTFEHGKEWPVAIIISRREGNNFYRICQIH